MFSKDFLHAFVKNKDDLYELNYLFNSFCNVVHERKASLVSNNGTSEAICSPESWA